MTDKPTSYFPPDPDKIEKYLFSKAERHLLMGNSEVARRYSDAGALLRIGDRSLAIDLIREEQKKYMDAIAWTERALAVLEESGGNEPRENQRVM